ncbi:MAG: isochorismatase family cysteine hydrolase [Armatimonadota bacterium]|nr:isochorismatase family cysteine hydrolase [Armatimonadota bacterium]
MHLGVELDPGRCALLVIDMQNDFVSPGGFHHRQGKPVGAMQAIIPAIQLLLRELPPAMRRVFVLTAREPDGSDSHWRFHRILPQRVRASREAEGSDRNALRGTWGTELVSLLRPGPADHVVYKRRYSAFYQTDLELRLRCWGIDTLFFAGVATEICVESTLRDAFMRDFDVVLVSDAVASWDAAAHRATLHLVQQSLGAVLTVEEVRAITWR